MITGFQTVLVVASKEILDHLRSKRMYVIGGLYALTLLIAALLVPRIFPAEALAAEDRIPTVLGYYFQFIGFTFTSLLAIVVVADALCGEWKDRSLVLLFSKPVSRRAVLAGKVFGAYASVVLMFAVVLVLGIVVLMVAYGLPSAEGWGRILGGLGFSLVALVPFIALGTLTTALFKTPMTSFLVAIGAKFLLFPALSTIGIILAFASGIEAGPEAVNEGVVFFFTHVDPDNLLDRASSIFTGTGDAINFLGFGGSGRSQEELLSWAFLAIVVHSVLYFTPAFWLVGKRDYP